MRRFSGPISGWVFDVLLGCWIGLFVAALLAIVPSLLFDQHRMISLVALVIGCAVGIGFMRRARTETGPAWFR
jgi:hypothetical protein